MPSLNPERHVVVGGKQEREKPFPIRIINLGKREHDTKSMELQGVQNV